MLAVFFILLWLGVCAYALWRGGQPERFVAVIFLVAALLPPLLYVKTETGMQVGIFVADVVMLILLVAIALKANRYWPMGIAAMQLLQVVGQLLKLADPHMLTILYWIGAVVWAYPMLILLWLGTIRHHNRVRKTGPEASWNSSSPRSVDRTPPPSPTA